MRVRGSTQRTAFARAMHRRYVDQLMDHYVSWREACGAVAVAYEGWRCAERADRDVAFSVYVSALDREEHAASVYQGSVAQAEAAQRLGMLLTA